MSNLVKFKGGPIFLNCGGYGPDDYVIKPIKSGRWTRVIMRYGRHFREDRVTGSTWVGDKEDVEKDRAAFNQIAKFMFQVCVPDNARVYARRKDKIGTLTASEFLARYGDVPEYRVNHHGKVL